MSLRDVVKKRIIKNIIQDAQSKMKKRYTVIVADDVTIKILHHCFRMHELNELDIGVVLNVRFPRERVKVSPIYFLSPDYESAKHMCADYKDLKEPKYAAPVHAYFNSKVDRRIIDLVKGENIRKCMKTFSEVPCDFLVLEHRVFSLYGGLDSFNNLYKNKENRSDELETRARQLVGLSLSLEEEPYIRYSGQSRDAKTLAELYNQYFSDTKAKLNKDWKPNSEHQSTLLIFDRKDDPLTPFLHSLDFQPMVHDLLHENIIENGTKIKNMNSNEEKKDEARAMPDENDQVWVRYRHQFIGDVLKKLPEQFNTWQKQNAVAKMRGKDGNVKTKELILAARDMPQYQKLVKQFTTNINMASKLSKISVKSGLPDIVNLEQDMATGISDEGGRIDKTRMQKAFSDVLMDDNKPLDLKLRTFMMYVISQGGMKPEQRKTLLKQSGFDDDTEDTIVNLGCLGVQLMSKKTGQPSGGCKQYWKDVVKAAKADAGNDGRTDARHTSFLKWVLQSHHAGSLSEENFKWIQKPGNQGKSKVVRSYRRHAKSGGGDEKKKNGTGGPRYIVYFLGGVSYAEIKECYEFSKKYDVDIFVGSTLVYSPQDYMNCFRAEPDPNRDYFGNEQKNDY